MGNTSSNTYLHACMATKFKYLLTRNTKSWMHGALVPRADLLHHPSNRSAPSGALIDLRSDNIMGGGTHSGVERKEVCGLYLAIM